MSDLKDAMELINIGVGTTRPAYRNYPGSGGIWTGDHELNIPCGHFDDWGLARATAEILNAVLDGRLRVVE